MDLRLSYNLHKTGLVLDPMRLCKIKYRLKAPTLMHIAPSIETRHHIAILVHQCRFQRCVTSTHDCLAQIVEAVTQVILRRNVFVLACVATEGVLEYGLFPRLVKGGKWKDSIAEGALNGVRICLTKQ